ncbi:hypothetical protein [Bartonella sp. DGB2]|uniref:hypothetical protein n=1 Tax=Bartonella sp. DGB2 TaxID=3388426 RepID=UPI0039903976
MGKSWLTTLPINIYCLCTAVAAMWISFTFTNVSGFTITFVSFTVAAIIFISCQFIKDRNIFRLMKIHPKFIAIINILTLISWLFAFLSLYNIEPSIDGAIFQGSLPVGVLVFELIARSTKFFSLRSLSILFIALCLVGLTLSRLLTGSDLLTYQPQQLYLGILLAAIGGFSGGLYAFISGRFHQKFKATTLEILSNRFFLLIILTAILGTAILGYGDLIKILSIEAGRTIKLLFLALVSVVLPIFALQMSIEKLGAAKVSIITPFIPALVFSNGTIRSWLAFTMGAFLYSINLPFLISRELLANKK